MMDVLTQEIVGGQLAPGEMLPRELDLADRFDVSRGVVREGIRALEERGLITVKHGKGATVNELSAWNTLDPDVLRPLLAGPYRVDVLEDYMEARRILEVEAAGLAAERAREEDLETMRRALAAMEQAATGRATRATEERFHEADIAFHQALIGGTRNRALCSLTESIHAAVLTTRFWLARPEYRLERAMPEHRAILAAVAARDPQAARAAMSTHLATVESYISAHNGVRATGGASGSG
jgi:GntR family transcriptional repressor for pyruvate dehydrogenase complex